MRSLRLMALVTCVGLLSAVGGVAQSQRPGLWECTTQMTMPGMSIPPQTIRKCLTAQDIAANKQYGPQRGDAQCSVSNFTQQGNQVGYDVARTTPQGSLKGNARGTTTAETDSMDLTLDFSPPIQGMAHMSQHVRGKRPGQCQ